MGERTRRAGVSGSEVVQAGEHRLARVESLRGLAALAVAVGHAWGLGHGYKLDQTTGSYFGRIVFGGGFGVFLFFALSGYLLFWPFARRWFGGADPIDLRRYALNRAVRILPLYYVAVILLLLIQEHGGSGEQWWRFMLFAENFSVRTVGTVDGVLWSLVVEVQFYVLLPLLALVTARIARGSRGWAAAFLSLLGAISLAAWIAKVQAPTHPSPLWRYNLPATFFYFVPGMLLALVRLRLEERPPRWLKGTLGASGSWLAASAVLWLVVFYQYDLAPLIVVASFLAIGACVLPLRESAARRMLDWRPLAAVGVASYSLYIWHTRVQEHIVRLDGFPHGTLAIMLITLPLSIAVALLSYRVVEAPFLRLRRRWSASSAPIDRDSGSAAPGVQPA